MDANTAYRRRWATLGVLCVSLLVIGLDNTILNVALPSLARSLHAGESQLQWMVDSYTLVFAGLLLTAGSLGDRFGRRGALFFGLAVFGASSLWAAWAGTANELILARAAMGVGGAFIMPSTLSVLTNSFHDAKERAKAIGVWAAVSGLGIVFGPTIGGWLLGHFWWGSVFLVNVPVALAGLVAGYWLVPESRDPKAPRVDVVGAVLSVIGLTALVWSIIEAPSRGWTSGTVLAGFGFAAVVLTGFAAWEMRVAQPMLNLRYFRNPRFAAASLSVTLVFFAMFGTVFFLTQYLQFVLGFSPLGAGQRILPIATMVLGAPIGIKLNERIGTKIVVTGGLMMVASALWLMSTTTTHSGYGHVAVVLALLGFGMGTVMAPATEAVMGALPKANAGVGSAVNDTTRQVGGALGVAVLGSILSSVYTGRLGDTVAGQPVPGVAKDGLAGALTVAAQLPERAGIAFAGAAKTAFIHGMDTTILVAAGVAVAGALLALVWLPARGRDETDNAADNADTADTIDTDVEAAASKPEWKPADEPQLEPVA
jgi:EmrB/QacA subfamily drug resistance transporter